MSIPQTQTSVRARNFEVVDGNGQIKAQIGYDNANSTPVLYLNDRLGHPAVLLRLTPEGYATMYFQRGVEEGKVAVGYLWGSDTLRKGEEDPLATWGIRIRDPNKPESLAVPNNSKWSEIHR
jgi:hypothetical protein